MTKKILVVAELRDEQIRNVTFEAIGAAKIINDDAQIIACVFGQEVTSLATPLATAGADRVIAVEHPHLQHYTPDGFSQAFLTVYEQEQPDAVILGHTALGKDLAPKLAATLQAALISDVTDIRVENGDVQYIRPIYAGKAFETLAVQDGVTFVTIRPNNIEPLPLDTSRTADAEVVDVSIENIRTVIQQIVRKASTQVDLTEAKVIVAGGRGVKSAQGFDVLQQLADALGGAVGASRGACDANYCDYSLQIGQTGKVVTPDIYIACGISGAIQHVAGMSNAKLIIAINKDPEAMIFSVADYGIVGDLFEVVPLLTAQLRAQVLT